MEATYLRMYGRHVRNYGRHSVAGVAGGAATAGVVLAALARHGHCVASVDIEGAFNHARHEDIRASLAAAGVPAEFAQFVAAALPRRRVQHRGEWLDISAGVGVGQGGPLSPLLFGAVVEGAARACVLPSGVVLVYYADNLYIFGQVVGDVKAALDRLVAALYDRGLHVGDAFACVPAELREAAEELSDAVLPTPSDGAGAAQPAWDCGHRTLIPLISPDCPQAVFLGVPASAAGALARVEALRRTVRRTRDISLQAALVILRDSVLPSLSWLALCPEVAAAAAQLHREMVDEIVARAHLGDARWVVEQLPAAGGLDLVPPAVAASAAMRTVVINALNAEWALRPAAWALARAALAADPASAEPSGGDFVDAVRAVNSLGEYRFDVERGDMRWASGDVIVRAPPPQRRAAEWAWSLGQPRAAEPAQAGGAVPREDGPFVALLGVSGAVLPLLSDEVFSAAVRLHAGLEPLAPDGSGLCPCCGAGLGPQHYHHCASTIGPARPAVHAAVQRHLAALFAGAGILAEVEVWIHDGALRVDLVLDGRLAVELKTLALTAPSRAKTTLADLEAGLAGEVAGKYGDAMRLLVVSRDGRVTPHGLAVLDEMQAMLSASAGDDGVARPTVLAAVGAAVAEADAAVLACWNERAAAALEAARAASRGAAGAAGVTA